MKQSDEVLASDGSDELESDMLKDKRSLSDKTKFSL